MCITSALSAYHFAVSEAFCMMVYGTCPDEAYSLTQYRCDLEHGKNQASQAHSIHSLI